MGTGNTTTQEGKMGMEPVESVTKIGRWSAPFLVLEASIQGS